MPAPAPLQLTPEPAEILPVGQSYVRRKTWWRRFGGDGFLISLGVHVVLALVAIFWVVTTWVDKKSDGEPDVFATGAGGGTQGDRAKIFEHRIKPRNARSMVSTPTKIVSKSAGSLSLPEMPNVSMSAMLSGNLAGGSSKGLGGGSGGGIGTGQGVGRGGAKNMVSRWTMFGGNFREPNMLEGTLYDLKRNRDGKERVSLNDTAGRVEAMKDAFQGIRRSGFKKEWLNTRYFQAPQKLYSSHIVIPPMDAHTATAAFNCQDVIQAPGWLAYYEGWFTPPEAGEYRFAGMGDDGLIVAVGGKMVFWSFWPEWNRQTWFSRERDWLPAEAYKEGGTLPGLGEGGRHLGSWVKLDKGRPYWLQIIFAEATGGLFSAELQVQKRGEQTDGMPDPGTALPIFKLALVTDEEMALKRDTKQRWTRDGPTFGCEINNVRQPPVSR